MSPIRIPIPLVVLAPLAVFLEGCPAPGPGVFIEDLEGRPVDPFAEASEKAIVFLFARTDCPVSNRYAPEVNRIVREYGSSEIRFVQVYPDPGESAEDVRKHLAEYGYALEAYRDPDHSLADYAGARVTPEAVVYVRGGGDDAEYQWVYRGRIDDRYVELGTGRREPTRRDLEEVLESIRQGRLPEQTTTEAVGCFIADLKL